MPERTALPCEPNGRAWYAVDGVRVRFDCTLPGARGLCKLWLVRDGRRLLLGTPEPEGDGLALRRTVSRAMLTEQGMRALGYRDVGRIAEGWQADFSLVRTETLCTVNRRRILTNLLYAGSGEQIDSVYVQGRPLLRNGQFVHHDLEHILQRCEEITARIERTLA